jgi:hypothetical protein
MFAVNSLNIIQSPFCEETVQFLSFSFPFGHCWFLVMWFVYYPCRVHLAILSFLGIHLQRTIVYRPVLDLITYGNGKQAIRRGSHLRKKFFTVIVIRRYIIGSISFSHFSKTDIYNFIPRVVGAFLSYYYPCVFSVGKICVCICGCRIRNIQALEIWV